MSDITPYITPAMLRATNYGISWGTFPKTGATLPDQIAAQLDVCHTLTNDMDTMANQALRASVDVEQEFGPDYTITMLPNGWARFRMSRSPILSILAGQVSPAGSFPPSWQTVPVSAMQTEHTNLTTAGTIIPTGASGPTAVLIAPGYVTWAQGRKGTLVQLTVTSGYPTCGINQSADSGASTVHVDDITGWWNGVAGARGTIYDPPLREVVSVIGVTPDVTDAVSGPGTLTLSTALQFDHHPSVGSTSQSDLTILLSSMPNALIQAGYYLATHYGLIRGTTASVMQTARGAVSTGGVKGAMDWYDRAEKIVKQYARVT